MVYMVPIIHTEPGSLPFDSEMGPPAKFMELG